MKAILSSGDREEAVKSVPANRKITDNFQKQVLADYSTIDLEAQQEVFPLDRVFRPDATNEWMVHYLQLNPATMADRLERWNQFQAAPC